MKSKIAIVRWMIRHLPMLVLAAALPAQVAQAGTDYPWEVRQIEGEDHLAIDQIAKFYSFTRIRNDSEITLEGANVQVKLKIGSTQCVCNGIKLILGNPMIEVDSTAFISRSDLSEFLDPVLRPNFIRTARDFNTVILDAADPGQESGPSFGVVAIIRGKLIALGYDVIINLKPEDVQKDSIGASAVFVCVSVKSGQQQTPEITTIAITPSVAEEDEAVAATINSSPGVGLSCAVHGSVVRRLGKDRSDEGLTRGSDAVLSQVRHPTIMIQAVGMARVVENPAYQMALAAGIVEGIQKYREAVKSNQPAEPVK